VKIKQVIADWFFTQEGGEEYSMYTVGNSHDKGTITQIIEHKPQGEGDEYYCDVHYSGGEVLRLFNINRISYEPNTPSEERT
jgi:hypothetical protein